MVSYAYALTKDGRRRAPRPLFGVSIVKPFPWLRIALGIGGMAFLIRREYKSRYEVSPREQFLRKVAVTPYGVLGMQVSLQGGLVRAGSEPDEGTCIVDPADLRHIFTTATGAEGASGAIYNMLGLRGPFPDDVVQAISRLCDAKLHKYSEKNNVIHVIDPDFREGTWSEREAALELSRAYRNLLHEFVGGEGDVLRVPPLSSGQRAGPLYSQLSIITQSAMAMAFDQLHIFDREYLLRRDKRIELCVFMNREWDLYQSVFKNCTQPTRLE